ncbi:MAG: ROK family protein [Microthrixaceae bacterium]
MNTQRVIGVDVGGSGVKAALVDVAKGDLASDRQRLDTPQPATPTQVAGTVAQLVDGLGGAPTVGVTVPAVVRDGVVRTAANIDRRWIGTDAARLFGEALGVPCAVLNDADAAGLAEMRFGAGVGRTGVVIVVTLGTGIGSALFHGGELLPNTELGHLEMRGMVGEHYAAAAVRKAEGLSWERWGRRVGRYLAVLNALFSPELIIVGGGVSRRFERFAEAIHAKVPDTEVVPAQLRNQAGIVGAAAAATRTQRSGAE